MQDRLKRRKTWREFKQRRRLKAIEALGGCCVECRTINPELLHFDHINPLDKKERFTDVLSWRWDRVVEILYKFQLLCDDCHDNKTAEDGHITRPQPFRNSSGAVIKYSSSLPTPSPAPIHEFIEDDSALPAWVTED